MDYLIRFAQVHEDFRLAEIEAIAVAECIQLSVVEYNNEVRIQGTLGCRTHVLI